MWSDLKEVGSVTNTVAMPEDGIIAVKTPQNICLSAYVNDVETSLQHLHIQAGDTIYFKLDSHEGGDCSIPSTVEITYNGVSYELAASTQQQTSYKEVWENPVPSLHQKIYEETKENKMSKTIEDLNIFTNPMNNNSDGLGGIAALALLGGLNGGRRDGYGGDNCDAAKTALNVAGYDGINHNLNSALLGITTQLNNGFGGQRDLDVMQKLGSIEKDIWQAESAVQLAVAAAQSDINNRISDGLLTAIQGQGLINQNISNASTANLVGQGDIKATILTSAAIGVGATKDAQYAVTTAIRDDGDRTRALIVAQNEANLNRLLTVSDLDRRDERSLGRQRDSEVNIINTNTAVATASAQQQQAQLQFQLQVEQNALLRNLANDIQVVRQGQTIFNSGTMAASGTQAAANTRVN